METKICVKCKEEKSVRFFMPKRKICRDCYLLEAREKYRNERGFLDSIKDLPRCKCCTILLNDIVCVCGARHGKESRKRGVCKVCYDKKRHLSE